MGSGCAANEGPLSPPPSGFLTGVLGQTELLAKKAATTQLRGLDNGGGVKVTWGGRPNPSPVTAAALEATQGHNDSFFSQLPYK